MFCLAGVATALAYLWLPDVALLVVGSIVAVLAGTALIASARRGQGWRQHQALTRELWVTASRIPPGRVLTDPGTGDLVAVERERGRLILVVASPTAGVARYVIGRWGAPVRPPVRRRPPDAVDADTPARALEVSTAELAKLVDQILRTAVLGVVG